MRKDIKEGRRKNTREGEWCMERSGKMNERKQRSIDKGRKEEKKSTEGV